MGKHRAPKLPRQERRRIRKEAADKAEKETRDRMRLWTRAASETQVDFPPVPGKPEGR